MNRRGSIAGHLLVWVSAVTGATAAVVLQAPGASPESWVVPGLVVTLLLLLLGKMVSTERTIGRIEGTVDGTLAENSKRDDSQDRSIEQLWQEARGVEGRLKEVRQEAIDQCGDQVKALGDRLDPELDDLQERVRELERGGTRSTPARAS